MQNFEKHLKLLETYHEMLTRQVSFFDTLIASIRNFEGARNALQTKADELLTEIDGLKSFISDMANTAHADKQ